MFSPLLQTFFTSQKNYWFFPSFFVIYLGIFFINQITENSFLSFLQLIWGTFLFLFYIGICFTIIIQVVFRRKFELWEFFSLSILASFLLQPLLLNIEFSLFKNISLWHPFINGLFLLVIAGLFISLKKTSLPTFSYSHFIYPLRSHPLLLSLVFGSIFLCIQILSFSPLPDLDPYKWLYKYTYQSENHLLDYTERPLFSSLIFSATTLTGITIFDFFKYFLPFLFLTTLIPGWLVARTFNSKNKQLIFLLFIFSVPNIVLYSGTAMPQVPLIFLSYFFVFFLLYSHLKQDNFFLYTGGLTMLLGFFYHETALLILPAWILPILITKYKVFLTNKKIFLLSLVILFIISPYLRPLYEFGARWISRLIPAFFEKAHFNWFYPAQYSNIDRNMMGWVSWDGIIKFYAYYVGPVLSLIFLSFFILLFHQKFRLFVFEKFIKSPAITILSLSFFTFFIIAEVFPRFPGIALLPDRAWVFAGIFGYIFLFLLFQYFPKISSKAAILFTVCFLIAISGTLYINYLKRYLISPLQLQSASWIQTTLPENRLFLSYGYRSLLPVHAKSPVVNIPNEIYCQNNLNEFEKVVTQLELNKKITTISPLSIIPTLSAPVPNRYIYTLTPLSSLKEKSLYIYYSQVHTKNPYRDRPYGMKSWGIKPCSEGNFLFDQFPQKFERVYQKNDDFDEVIIWKVL